MSARKPESFVLVLYVVGALVFVFVLIYYGCFISYYRGGYQELACSNSMPIWRGFSISYS